VLAIGTAMALVFVISLVYSTFRHVDRRMEKGVHHERSLKLMLQALASVDSTVWLKNFSDDVLWGLSQHVAHYGMLTEHYVYTDQLEAKPFNTFKFCLVYPIPRRMWPDKPESLGRTITHQMLGRKTTWGTGVAGHSAYEGGVIISAMLAYFVVMGVRMFDEPLKRQPQNPFLIAMLASAAMHIIGWPRGDLAVMTFEVGECLLFTFALSFGCRMLFGTDRTWRGAYPTMPGQRIALRSQLR
jgi:hypothetical protein